MIFVFIAILSLVNLGVGIELKCSFIELPYRGGYKSCDLSEKMPILFESVVDNFTFTGLTEEQKNEVRVIRFQTANISFVPDEATTIFPNLEIIEVFDRNLKILTFDYVNELLKFVKPKITEISFWGSQINNIDPHIMTIFENMTGVYLKGNQCIDENFETSDELDYLNAYLRACFRNFNRGRDIPKPIVCPFGEWQCDSGECIDERYRCNYWINCADSSDEYDCLRKETGPELDCQNIELECNTSECIDARNRCDVQSNYTDSSDDCDCNKGDLDDTELECSAVEFMCDDGFCIPESKKCDGIFDCLDEEDEDPDECGPVCSDDEFYCDGKCLHISKKCDNIYDCADEADEADCPVPTECNPDEFRCEDYECISELDRCNGIIDCSNDSDEKNCPSCKDDAFHCVVSKECIPGYQRCDGSLECLDASDEEGCPKYVPKAVGCPFGEWKCDSGECIDERYRCNNRTDCVDSSDEYDCLSKETVPLAAKLVLPAGHEYNTGTNIELTCEITGQPEPEIMWYKDDKDLYETDRIRFIDRHGLIINSAVRADSGRYKCYVRNRFSEAYAEEVIRVEGPYLPHGCIDNPFFANCALIVKGNYCNHHYYFKFCCRSCTLGQQLH